MSDTIETTCADTTRGASATPTDGADALARALSAPCDIRLRVRQGEFLLSIPALGLVVRDTSLDAAYERIRTQRETRIREFASLGMLDLLAAPASEAAGKNAGPSLRDKLRPFFIKCVVVSVLFLAAMNMISHSVGDIGYVLEKKLQAVRNWTPEDVEKQRALSAKTAERLGPVIRELMPMFRQPDEASPANNAAKQKQPGQ